MKIRFHSLNLKPSEQVVAALRIAIYRYDQCSSYQDLPLDVAFMLHYGGTNEPGFMRCKFKREIDWEIHFCLEELDEYVSFDYTIERYFTHLRNAMDETLKRATKKGMPEEYQSAINEVIDCICRTGEYSR